MSAAWTVIAALAVVNFAMKAAGPVLAGDRALPALPRRLIDASAPALIAALIVAGTFAEGRELTVDARAGGLAAAILAVLARAPMLVVVTAAAATTAALRAAL